MVNTDVISTATEVKDGREDADSECRDEVHETKPEV